MLVVDDDRTVRDVLASMLRELGYDAVTVSSGEEAIGIYTALEHAIDLVVLDMVMPGGLDGYDTFRGLRAVRGDAKVVLCSGYADGDRIGRALEEGALTFLPKPFDLAQVASVVHKALRAERDDSPSSPRARSVNR